MPRLIHDPNTVECPAYGDVEFEAVREMIRAGHQGQIALTNEEAAEKLKTAWQRAQVKKIDLWNEQARQDQTTREEEERIEQEQAALRHQEKTKEEEDARREAERKKPKINNFDLDLVVPGHITPCLSSYALNKIKNLQYVELDYFTVKGCNEALLERELTSNHDTLGLTRVDDVATFQPISSLRPSKSARRDEELLWEEMVFAKNKMLEHMSNFGTWPAAHIKATMMLFVELENHPTRAQHLGNQIMVTYAARARRQWFDMLELNQGFNLGKIGVDLMRNVSDKVQDEARQREMTEVKIIPSHQKSSLINLLLPSTTHFFSFVQTYHPHERHATLAHPNAACNIVDNITRSTPVFSLNHNLQCHSLQS